MTRALTLLALAAALPATAADWPVFRGPGLTGVAPADADPPTTWGDTSNLKWKTPLPGSGSSSPVVVGDRVFVTYYSGYGIDRADPGDPAKLVRHLACLDRKTGTITWTEAVPAHQPEDPYRGFINEHGYASSTPAADADAVYVFFGKSGVLAYSHSGTKLWQTPVGTGSDLMKWGSSASVVLHKNLVIVNAASESNSVRALDKKTGIEVWKAESKRLGLSYGTPALVKVDAARTDLVVSLPMEVWGLDPDTGKQLWTASIKVGGGNASPSVLPGDGVAYITGGFTSTGMCCVRAGGSGDVTKTHVVWQAKPSSYVPTPVLLGDRLYWVNENGFAVTADAKTGTKGYDERLPGAGGGRASKPYYASVIAAKDRLYAVSRKNGVFVLATGPEYKEVAHNRLTDDTDFNATPAVVGRQLFLRSNKAVYCLEAP